MGSLLVAVWCMVVDVVLFWSKKLWDWWWNRNSPVKVWERILRNAESYEEWQEAAQRLDSLQERDLWRNNPISKHYDWRLIEERSLSIAEARAAGDVPHLVNTLRSGLVRNLGDITAPRLYNRAFSGTKYLIEEYVTQIAEAIEDISKLPTLPRGSGGGFGGPLPADNGGGSGISGNGSGGGGNDQDCEAGHGALQWSDRVLAAAASALSTQAKLDLIHDARQAFGRSTLVLQGGAIFGLCHLGVVKALFLRGLLPRIITGTATGALIAALVSIHTEEELPGVLEGTGIDLSAFTKRIKTEAAPGGKQSLASRWQTLMRRIQRFRREGYFLDVTVLEDCVRANVGNLTFEEAYNRSKRVLNITVATAGQGGIPTLLNYITAPNVLIWTAAVASNASTPSLYGHRQTTVLCKDASGNIVPWAAANTADFRHWTLASYADGRDSPLVRISELFNVNHFIVSQARPYLIPFLQSDMHGPSLWESKNRLAAAAWFMVRMVGLEVRHRLRQLDTVRLLPAGIRRFLVDERVPGASMTLVPEVAAADFIRLLETPTHETLRDWILRGERSVWPAVAALRVRCAIEVELDRAYQVARQLKPAGLRRKSSIAAAASLEKDR